jgi:hypothetical protein
LSLLKFELVGSDLAVVVDGLGHLALAVREQVVLSGLLGLLPILHRLLGRHRLPRLLSVPAGVNGRGLDGLSLLEALLLPLIQHQVVEVFHPFAVIEWSEVILEAAPSGSEEIVEDGVGSDRLELPKDPSVIVLSLVFVTDGVVGLIDLHKLLVGFFIVRVRFGVVLQGKFPVSILDLFKGGILGDAQNFVGIVQRVGVVLLKEFLLIFV